MSPNLRLRRTKRSATHPGDPKTAVRRVLRRLAHDTRGFTLIEVLVAMVTGLIVTGAAFATLEFSLSQSSRIADRTSADQRGRLAMEKILLELHSSCVTILVNPIQAGSTATSLVFLSQTAPEGEPFFTSMTKHKIYLSEGELKDAVYKSTGGTESTKWTFETNPSKTTTLLKGVSAPSSAPMFEYLRYTGTSLSTLLTAPALEEAEAKLAAKVNIRLVVAPESGSTKGPSGDRQIELSDSAVIRLTPATEVGQQEPCE